LNGLKDCLALNVNIKTGLIDDRTGIELLLLKYGV